MLQANKVYPLKNESAGLAGGVKGDPMERAEELARMREEALREMDQDNDLLVSASEFNRWTHSSQFQDVPVEDDDWLVRSSPLPPLSLAHSLAPTRRHSHISTFAHFMFAHIHTRSLSLLIWREWRHSLTTSCKPAAIV